MRSTPLQLSWVAALGMTAATATAGDALSKGEGPADWQLVPAPRLAEYRGGVDLGTLIANFAIQRVVEVDGVVIARMQIVISHLDNLGNGAAPTVTISGPAAALVQILNNSGVAGAAPVVQAPATASTPSASAAAHASLPSASGAVSGGAVSSGAVSSGAVSSGAAAAVSPSSTAAQGLGGTFAVNVPTGTSSSGSGGAVSPATPVVVLPAVVQSDSSVSSSLTQTKTIPLGNTGQVAVLSNLPNAPALTAAIQNQVHGAVIQAQTTISANLNSLTSLNGLSLANQIRQQVALR